ncbi:MAG: NAD(P)-dependent dehydrogenase (short-subunit alcohol dehydrogenase family) [Candidatus Azotimanducaceae bacterium]
MIAVIGGTSGIGLETAKYLCELGYDTIVGGRRQLQEMSVGGSSRLVDVTDEASIEAFFSDPDTPLEGIVYAAGITAKKQSIEDFDPAVLNAIMATNVTGLLLCLKHAYKQLKASKGRVVVVNSLAARSFSQFSGFEYTTSKSALSGVVKQLAIEFAVDGVLINSVFPSMTATPMLIANVDPELLRTVEQQIPLQRIVEPLEVAKAIAFLVSRDNTYMTGCGLDLNGGQYLNG